MSVVILGAGNVGFHLTRALVQNSVHVKQIFNRTLQKAESIGEENNIRYTDKISELEKADIYIIACSDDAIEELSHYIPYSDVLVVHTSGSMPIETLKGNYHKGVLYPLQTLSFKRKVDYNEMPFFIEAEREEDQKKLTTIAEKISGDYQIVNSDQRLKLHLAAVFACNFVNHLYEISGKLLENNHLKFEYLMPLIQETTMKLEYLTPREAQTGPAERWDEKAIEKHLELLKDDSHLLQMYQWFTKSIQKSFPNEL